MIDIAVVEDNRMFAEGLRAWADGIDDIRVLMVAASVSQLLWNRPAPPQVVVLDPTLRAEPDPARNVRRLLDTGHRVLVVDGSPVPGAVAPVMAAGAHGYLTRDHDLDALAASLRAIAAGGTAWSLESAADTERDVPQRAPLSEREYQVLMEYTSGVTLVSVARRLGIKPATAHTYLKRAKAKYRRAGILVTTKLELAQQVHSERLNHQPDPTHRAANERDRHAQEFDSTATTGRA